VVENVDCGKVGGKRGIARLSTTEVEKTKTAHSTQDKIIPPISQFLFIYTYQLSLPLPL